MGGRGPACAGCRSVDWARPLSRPVSRRGSRRHCRLSRSAGHRRCSPRIGGHARTCAPVPLAPEHTAAAQGIDTGTFSVLLVTVTRPAPPLSARIDQLRGCPSFNFGHGEDISTVTVSLLPAPPVDADDRGADRPDRHLSRPRAQNAHIPRADRRHPDQRHVVAGRPIPTIPTPHRLMRCSATPC